MSGWKRLNNSIINYDVFQVRNYEMFTYFQTKWAVSIRKEHMPIPLLSRK